ncbi:MAG TPA: hypothetical protein VF662_00875 [Allosphingosinicella sp.]
MTQNPVVTGYRMPSTYMGWEIDRSDSGDTTGDTRPQELAYEQAREAFKPVVKPAKDTPCIGLKPGEAPLTTINQHAAGAVSAISGMDATRRELLAVIYVYNGTVEKLLPQTSNQMYWTIFDYMLLPVGAVVVGAVHNHPVGAEDPTLPTTADVQFFDKLRLQAEDTPWFHVSENPITYIFDTNSNATYAYDRLTVKAGTTQCTL